jgi:glycosyltransferase involved in cell wall biosynthesis
MTATVALADGERISIIVPCYNGATTLTAALESALKQDAPVEVIVIDDGSNDNSLAVARSFQPTIRVIAGPNRGASAARNIGIAETSSEWIVFLDSDDLLEPGTLKRRMETLRASQADVVICDWREIVDDGGGGLAEGALRSIDWEAMEADAELATATHIWATTAAILYRRSIVDKIGGFRADLPIIQDARFLFDAAYHGARFVHSAHVGARYRVLPSSLSRRDPARFSQDVLLNGQQIQTLWRARSSFDDARRNAVLGIYNTAGRDLFAAGHPSYFEAVDSQRELGLRLPLHSMVAAPLARLVGLRAARSLLSLVDRG